MKHLLLTLLLCPILVFGQCPPDGTFSSQAEIDAFAIDYPNCTDLNASLVISGDDIIDLSGLGQITACRSISISNNLILENTSGLNPNLVLSYVVGQGNSFAISNNASLLEISGLENLLNYADYESSFQISNNPMLLSVAGVPNSFNALNSFSIHNNDSLLNLVGLENYGCEYFSITDNDALVDLTGLEEAYGSDFVIISDNDALESFNGLIYLGSEHDIIIENNAVLADINLDSDNTVGYGPSVTIRNNPSLSVCNVNWVCQYLFTNGIEESIWFPGTFENNAPGCNTNVEVETGCELHSNDNCSEVYYPSDYYIEIGETIIANNEFATTSLQVPTCNDIENRQDVWFAFYSGNNTSVDIMTEAGYNVQVWENGFCYDAETNPLDGGCGTILLENVLVMPNTSYLLQVWDDGTNRMSSNAGWFSLTVDAENLSIADVEVETTKIFPNPVSETLNIQSDTMIENITLFNILGQKVLESEVYSQNHSLNISNLEAGLYMTVIHAEDKESTYKIIKK